MSDIDRIFREHNRYTGDGLPGEPVGAPLPYGDPTSGPYGLKKPEMRDWGNAIIYAAAVVDASKFTWRGDWAALEGYKLNDAVAIGGASYICTVAHTSDVFVTDLNNLKWNLLAGKGADGSGLGDLLASENLSDLDDVAVARGHLGLGSGDDVEFKSLLLDNRSPLMHFGELSGSDAPTKSGFHHYLATWADAPSGGGGHLIHNDTDNDGAAYSQTAITDAGDFYLRNKAAAGVVGEWRKLALERGFYESGPLTFSNGVGFTLAHGLGVAPKRIRFLLECVTTDAGYQSGDMVDYSASPIHVVSTSNAGISTVIDSSHISLRLSNTSNGLSFLRKDNGQQVYLNFSRWKLHVEAYA